MGKIWGRERFGVVKDLGSGLDLKLKKRRAFYEEGLANRFGQERVTGLS